MKYTRYILNEQAGNVRTTLEVYEDGSMNIDQWDVWNPAQGDGGPDDTVLLSLETAAVLVAIFTARVRGSENDG